MSEDETTFTNLFDKLVKLKNETKNSFFIITHKAKTNKVSIRIVARKIEFTSDSINGALTAICEYIERVRVKDGDKFTI